MIFLAHEFWLKESNSKHSIYFLFFFFFWYTIRIFFRRFHNKMIENYTNYRINDTIPSWLHRLNTFIIIICNSVKFRILLFPFSQFTSPNDNIWLLCVLFITYLLVLSSCFFFFFFLFSKPFSEHWVTSLPLIPNKLYTQQSHHMKFIETIFLPEFIHWITLE